MLGKHSKKLKITRLSARDFQLFLVFSQHPVYVREQRHGKRVLLLNYLDVCTALNNGADVTCRNRAIQPSTTLSSYFIMLKCIFTHKNYKPPKMFSPSHALYTAQALTQIKFLFNVVLIHAVKIKRL